MVLFFACDKEELSQSAQEIDPVSLTIRNISDESILWIQEFQSSLQDQINNNNTNLNYTNEEVAFGLEWLFNYTYSDSVNGIKDGMTETIFELPDDENWIPLYTAILKQVEHEIASKSRLHFNFLTIDIQTIDNEDKMVLSTNFTRTSEMIEQYLSPAVNQTLSCDNPPFEDEHLFVVSEGTDESGFPCSIDFFSPCRQEGACSIPGLHAIEAIEAFHNFEIKSDFICKEPDQQIAFVNTQTVNLGFSQGGTLDDILFDCGISMPAGYFTNHCDCLSSDLLNCLYCFTDDLIINTAIDQGINIPNGSELVDIDIIVEAINLNNGQLYYSITLTYGEVICIPSIIREDPPISIAIECC